ncbi:MAG: T9SS type A sorting domain-containing protein [Gemmatimonadota bacterium]|nr:MAG: T9SS type A sorting domain-containing protein [Gemmatimonadota bacterium]
MTRIGNNLWYFDESYWWIGQTTTSGGLGATFYPSDNTIKDLAWDGTNIWAINPSGILTGYSPTGSLTGAIPGLLTGGWGLTCDGTFLWASDPESDKIYQISLQGELPKGDVNSDGSVDLLDLVDIVNHILGLRALEDGSFRRADCNEDGGIDVIDALGLVNVILEVGGCESVSPKIALSDQEMEILESLKPYVSPSGYKKFMTLVEHNVEIPSEYRLSQNYPNPFNPRTDIRYEIPGGRSSIHTVLKVYNVLGQEVRTLVNEIKEPGYYQVTWDGRDDSGFEVSSGVYFYQIRTENFLDTKRMVFQK